MIKRLNLLKLFFNLFKVVEMKSGGMFFMLGYYLEKVPQPYACQLQMFWLWGLLLSVLNIPGELLQSNQK